MVAGRAVPAGFGQASAHVRRRRLLEDHQRDPHFRRRAVGAVLGDLASRGRRTDREEPEDRAGVQASPRHGSAVHVRQPVRGLYHCPAEGRGGAGGGRDVSTRRRTGCRASIWRATGGRRRRTPRRRPGGRGQPAPERATHRSRHHVTGRWTSDDGREGRELPAARRQPGVAGVLQRNRRRRPGGGGRARRPRRTWGPTGGRWRPGPRRRRQREGPQAARIRPRAPQSRQRRRDDDRRGHRVRLERQGHTSRLRGLLERCDEGWGVHSPGRRRLGDDAALGPRPVPQHRVRRGRHAGHVHQRPGGVRQAGLAVPSLLLEGGRRQRDRNRVIGDAGHAERHGRRGERGSAVLSRRRADLPRDRASTTCTAGRGREAQGADCRRPVVDQRPVAAADAAGARGTGTQPQLSGRHPFSRSPVRAAGDARPADGQSRRRPRAGHRHVGYPVPEGGVVGPDLQRRLPAGPEDRHADARARALGRRRHLDLAGRPLCRLLRRRAGPLAHVPRRGRRARQHHREDRQPLSADQ